MGAGTRGGVGEATVRGDAVFEPDLGSDRTAWSLVNPLVPVQRLTVGSAIDLGFDILRYRFATFAALTVTLFLPIQLFDLAVTVVVDNSSSTQAFGNSPLSFLVVGSASSLMIVTLVLQSIALSMLGIGGGHLVAAMVQDRSPGYRELLVVCLRRSWVALGIVVMTGLLYVLFACTTAIGVFVAQALTFVSSISAGAEKLGPLAALRRSMALTQTRFGAAVVLSLGSLCTTLVVRAVLVSGPAALAMTFQLPEGPALVVRQASALSILMVQPLTVCIAGAGYMMFRTRGEGLDIQHRLRELAAASAIDSDGVAHG